MTIPAAPRVGRQNRRMIRLSPVSVGPEEEAAVVAALRSGRLAMGPEVAALEERFRKITGTRHAVAVSSGTAALIAALRSLGIGPGDEVITSPFTFAATVNAVLEVGATARLVDVLPDGTIDPGCVASAVGERTAAVLPVHLYGYPADMAGLRAAAEGIPIVEDAAQAIGARFDERPVGSFGVGCFSLYATKNVAAGEGGVVTCDDDQTADRLRLLRNQGSRRRYEYETVGHNSRLTDIQAALANPQLDRLERITERRRANAAELTAGLHSLPGIRVPAPDARRHHVYHLYTIVVGDEAGRRDDLGAALARAGIETGVVYPKVLHHYRCYAEHPGVIADPTPVAVDLTRRVLALPVHPALEPHDPATIVAAVRSALGH